MRYIKLCPDTWSFCFRPMTLYRYHDRVSSAFLDSGSLEQDGSLCIVAMKKEKQTGLVHHHRLGKGQCHTDKTSQTLSERVIPPLHMGSFSGLFAHRRVLLLWDDRSIDFQKIRKAMTLAILVGNGLPQPLARLFASIPNRIGDHLPRPAAQGNPNPGVVRFFEDKRPELIQFQYCGSGIFGIRGEQGGS